MISTQGCILCRIQQLYFLCKSNNWFLYQMQCGLKKMKLLTVFIIIDLFFSDFSLVNQPLHVFNLKLLLFIDWYKRQCAKSFSWGKTTWSKVWSFTLICKNNSTTSQECAIAINVVVVVHSILALYWLWTCFWNYWNAKNLTKVTEAYLGINQTSTMECFFLQK